MFKTACIELKFFLLIIFLTFKVIFYINWFSMATNKINVKSKIKEDKTKLGKSTPAPDEDENEVDFSVLRKPVFTSVTGFAQARNIFDLATEEVCFIC